MTLSPSTDPVPRAGTAGTGFVTVVEPRPGGARLRLAGELDLAAAPALAASAEALPPAGEVHVDLCAVTFLDSAGLHALLTLHDALVDRGCPVQLVGPQPGALRLLDFAAASGWLRQPVRCPERPEWAVAPPQRPGPV